MPLLSQAQILEIQKVAMEAGLARQRDVLLAGLPPVYVAGLPENNAGNAQLLLDLSEMNRDGTIDGEIPLENWLLTAAALSGGRSQVRQQFFNEMAEAAALAAAATAPPPADPRVPERILFRNALLPAHFLAGAVRTAQSVARLVVPQIEGGTRRVSASSNAPATAYGTGWLIGRRHVITNWHVVEARAISERRPEFADVERQCAETRAEFDYDEQDVPPGFTSAVAAVEHHDAKLDYAILRLAEGPPRRGPLPLRGDAFTVSADDPFPVNIIQHPAGASKQLGIRNNLASSLTATELTYFTDTAGGSSGSPVCDDAWRVVALHRGTRPVLQMLNFQGKGTAWINSGTPIRAIIADLQARAAPLWGTIGATIA